MGQFQFLAQPLWVNLLVLTPFGLYFVGRSRRIQISGRQLLFATVFALAFGFVEAAVVVYLHAAAGLLPGYTRTLSEVQRLGGAVQQLPPISELPQSLVTIKELPESLLTVEVLREAATIVMLLSIALLADSRAKERWAVFLWTFAWWDISYYAALRATIRWPTSLKDLDVLFLIPVPWVAQVWFPLLVSALTLIAVGLGKKQIQA
jgi:hypothetical protein